MTPEKKEIRDVLLGKTMILEDGRLSSLGPEDFIMARGIGDGAGAVRFFGVGQRSRLLESELTKKKMTKIVQKCMEDIGRGLILQGQPETVACFFRFILTKPAVLTFRFIEDKPVVTAWAGRGLTGWISTLRALAIFGKQLPKTIWFSEEEAPKEQKEKKEKKEKKQRRKKKDVSGEEVKPVEEPANKAEETVIDADTEKKSKKHGKQETKGEEKQ